MTDTLYKEELMEIYKNPAHKGLLESPNATSQEVNPFCGDNINLQLDIRNGTIEKARFSGSSCAVSTIAAEKMLEKIEGTPVEECLNLTQEDLLETLGIDVSMTRIKCATLVLTAIKNALKNYQQRNKNGDN
jgi:nitrogen fixation protein NifU and related proteins